MEMIWPYNSTDLTTVNITAGGTTYYRGTIVLDWLKLLMKWYLKRSFFHLRQT